MALTGLTGWQHQQLARTVPPPVRHCSARLCKRWPLSGRALAVIYIIFITLPCKNWLSCRLPGNNNNNWQERARGAVCQEAVRVVKNWPSTRRVPQEYYLLFIIIIVRHGSTGL